MPIVQSRRRFLVDAALAGAAGLGGAGILGLTAAGNPWLQSLRRKQRSLDCSNNRSLASRQNGLRETCSTTRGSRTSNI